MSTTTQADNITATLPLGILALAQHMVDHTLPAPYSIDAPNPCLGDKTLIVRLGGSDLVPWLESLHLDSAHSEPCSLADYQRERYECRLPDSGVQVTVTSLRPFARHLAVVVNR